MKVHLLQIKHHHLIWQLLLTPEIPNPVLWLSIDNMPIYPIYPDRHEHKASWCIIFTSEALPVWTCMVLKYELSTDSGQAGAWIPINMRANTEWIIFRYFWIFKGENAKVTSIYPSRIFLRNIYVNIYAGKFTAWIRTWGFKLTDSCNRYSSWTFTNQRTLPTLSRKSNSNFSAMSLTLRRNWRENDNVNNRRKIKIGNEQWNVNKQFSPPWQQIPSLLSINENSKRYPNVPAKESGRGIQLNGSIFSSTLSNRQISTGFWYNGQNICSKHRESVAQVAPSLHNHPQHDTLWHREKTPESMTRFPQSESQQQPRSLKDNEPLYIHKWKPEQHGQIHVREDNDVILFIAILPKGFLLRYISANNMASWVEFISGAS